MKNNEEKITTIYYIRHSVKLSNNMINTYMTNQSKLFKNEKIVLSVNGERRAELLSNEEELQNIDVVYTSNCVRTLQTAKYLMVKQNLKANIDERLDERRTGIPNDDKVKDWYTRQYLDENYKTIGGESKKDVENRMYEVFKEVIRDNKGKRIAIFSHGYAITMFLLKYCKLEDINKEHNLKISYKDKVIFNGKINSPDVFKVDVGKDNEILNIENIKFDDLEYDDVN